MMNRDQSKRLFQGFTIVATILGFVVDSITIISILFSTEGSDGAPTFLSSDIQITPLHALTLWILAAFTYTGLLHMYWAKNQAKMDLNPGFGGFLVNDLVLSFRFPWLLLPAVVSFLLLFWVVIAVTMFLGATTIKEAFDRAFCDIPVSLLLAICIIMLFVTRDKETKRKKLRADVDANWYEWEDRIRAELERNPWVDVRSLQDKAELWDVDAGELGYALAKFISANPRNIAYGVVIRRIDGLTVSQGKALIATWKFPSNEYYYHY